MKIVEDPKLGKVAYPKHQIFKKKLAVVKIEDIHCPFSTHHEFKQQIRKEIQEDGWLNPIVVTKGEGHFKGKYKLHSGPHRLKYIRTQADAMMVYLCKDENEVKFFAYLNLYIWQNHPSLTNLSFCFAEGEATRRLKKTADRVKYLFDMKTMKAKEPRKKRVVKKKVASEQD